MATKTVTARLDGDGLRLTARTGSGHTIAMDSAEGDTGARPAELLMVALAGCTAMDVVSILRKKRQTFRRYEVSVAGDQRDDPPPHVFEQVRVIHAVDGEVDVDALHRAIELSATKYCTISGNLALGVTQIHHAYVVRGAAGEQHQGEVVVTGPQGARTSSAAGSAAADASFGSSASAAAVRTRSRR